MANLDNPNGFKAVMNLGGGSVIPMMSAKVAASVNVNPGDALVMTSNGLLNVATATSAAILGVAQSKIVGVAGVTPDVNYVPALETIVFSGQCSGTMTPVNMGESVDIEGTTGIMEINEDAQVVGCARLIGIDPHLDNAVGLYCRVWFTWNKSQFTGQA